MARLTSEQLNSLKEHYGVNRIWSWSRLNTYVEQPWVYYMTYLHKDKVRTDNVYSFWGSLAHDIVQDCYDGKHSEKDLPTVFSDKVLDWRITYSDIYRFSSENVERGYIDNLTHYFTNFEKLPYKLKNEVPVKIVLTEDDGHRVFIGYIDSIYKDENDEIYLLDYKTSSISGFTGKKLMEHSKQLILYALGIHQKTGIPFEKIHPRFDMMKYVNIEYLQKNGKWKSTIKERTKIVESQRKKIEKALADMGMDSFDIEELVDNAVEKNDMGLLPEPVQQLFRISPAYIDVPLDKDTVYDLANWIVEKVKECEEKEKGDHEVEFPQPRLDENGNEFYFKVLAPQLLAYLEDYTSRNRGNDLSVDDLDDLDSLFK